MEMILTVVFGVMAVGLGGLAAWLWRGQARLAAAIGSAGDRTRGLEGELAAARGAAEGAERDAGELRTRAESLVSEVGGLRVVEAELRKDIESVGKEFAEREKSLVRERVALEKQIAELDTRMAETFEALSAKSLRAASDDFLKRAKAQFEGHQKEDVAELEKRKTAVEELVKPIERNLQATRDRLESIEKSRGEQFARFHEHMEQITGASTGLRDETAKLSKALSRPEVRGQWGEVQLRKVAELAGMTSYCDYSEQESRRDSEGNLLRPDMIVKLPNERVIAVDAKTNTYAYLEAVNAEGEVEREAHLTRFARHVADQAKKLGDKKYWSVWDGSPEFVVMFVPGDHFIDAALSRRPEIFEQAAQHGVILASPSTLIGLLRAVEMGWRERRLAEEARDLYDLGRKLHKSAADAFEHVASLGRAIESATKTYNKMVGSIETRMLPGLRRFEEAGAKSAKPLVEMKEVEVETRSVRALPGAEDMRAFEEK